MAYDTGAKAIQETEVVGNNQENKIEKQSYKE
jgi:hypothetical protein